MKRYRVTLSARKVGALGVWSKYSFEVSAKDKIDAVEEARIKAYDSGFEHLSLVSVLELRWCAF